MIKHCVIRICPRIAVTEAYVNVPEYISERYNHVLLLTLCVCDSGLGAGESLLDNNVPRVWMRTRVNVSVSTMLDNQVLDNHVLIVPLLHVSGTVCVTGVWRIHTWLHV